MLPIVDTPTINTSSRRRQPAASGKSSLLQDTTGQGGIENHFDRNIELELALKSRRDVDKLRMLESIADKVDIHSPPKKTPKGLGHAIYCARAFVGREPFAVLLGDDIVVNDVPCTRQLMEVYEKYQCTVLGVGGCPR